MVGADCSMQFGLDMDLDLDAEIDDGGLDGVYNVKCVECKE